MFPVHPVYKEHMQAGSVLLGRAGASPTLANHVYMHAVMHALILRIK